MVESKKSYNASTNFHAGTIHSKRLQWLGSCKLEMAKEATRL